jgi:photosystem II stability/assembly factor-like uncharacterized protein
MRSRRLSAVAALFVCAVLQWSNHQAGRASAQEASAAPEHLPVDPDAVVPSQTQQKDEENDMLFPLKRELWFHQQRAYPNEKIPPGAYWRALTQKKSLIEQRVKPLMSLSPQLAAAANPFSSVNWTSDGPQPTPAYFGTVPYSGRATSIALHPTDPNTIYLGTAGGGVWKTSDGGHTWAPLTDSQPSLAIGAIAVDPNNPNTVYAGTGESDFSGDSWYGQGLLKSTDAGATWTVIRTPFTTGDTAPDFTSIAVQPGNSNVVLAANTSGLYRSADGGQTWTLTSINSGVSSVLFDVKNANTVYAGIGWFYSSPLATVYMSTDAGKTWTPIDGSGTTAVPAPASVLRTALSETADGTTVYAAFANVQFTAPGSLYSTSNHGASWTKLNPPSATDGLDWYRNGMAVDPANPQVIWAGGAGLYQSSDGGQTWKQTTTGQSYADQHAFVFSADGSRLYLADDGGIFINTTPTVAGSPFTSLNQTISTLTFYPGFSIWNTNSLLGGSQDHGLNLYTGSPTWSNGEQADFCGDGNGVFVDAQGQYAYAHCQGGRANWAVNATGDSNTSTWVSAQAGISTSDPWPWWADIKGDPQNIATVYTGTNHLYQSTNNATSWTSISPDLTAGRSTISTIAVSPTDSNTVYVGAGDGTVSVTTNATSGAPATWTTLKGLPNRSISKIVVASDSPHDVYLTVNGFDSGHVFHSTNGGSTWSNISGDLPNTPVNSILLDPSLANTIYLATDTGVYVTSNAGTNWTPLGQGLPNVVVFDILMNQATRALRVVTHGRGAWEAVVPLVGLANSTGSLSFGNQTQNTTSAAQVVTLSSNLATGAVSLTGIQITGPFTQTNNCGTTLNSGATCTVNVSFAPTTAGNANGALTISSSTNTVVIALSGVGLGVPNAVLGESSYTYSNQPVGITSQAQAISLANTGDAPLTNIAVSIAGSNKGDFSQSNNCGTTLAAGAACNINVTFTPAGTGSLSATLNIADNASGSPQTVALSGQGSAPFSITAASTTATASTGTNATYQLTVAAAQGFPLASQVSLSCTGLPSLSSCQFSPTSIPSGSTSQNVALTITTTPASLPAKAAAGGGEWTVVAALSLPVFFLLSRQRRRSWILLLLLVVVIAVGCGGGPGNVNNSSGGTSNPGTPTGNYTITVTAAQGSVFQTTQALTLTVK